MMNRPFYLFMMKFRHAEFKNEMSQLANDIYDDLSFPKHSEGYHEISSYLELNGNYVTSMSLFDEAWEKYTYDEGIHSH